MIICAVYIVNILPHDFNTVAHLGGHGPPPPKLLLLDTSRKARNILIEQSSTSIKQL